MVKKNTDGTWNLEFKLTDKYDFTEFVKFWELEGTWEKLGWAINDLAHWSQKLGAITPFDVEIRFTIKNYQVKNKVE